MCGGLFFLFLELTSSKSKIHYSVHFSSSQTCWCSEKIGPQKETEEALIKKQIAFFQQREEVVRSPPGFSYYKKILLFLFHLPFKNPPPTLFLHLHLEFTNPDVREIFKMSSCAVAALRGYMASFCKNKIAGSANYYPVRGSSNSVSTFYIPYLIAQCVKMDYFWQ